MDLPLRASGAAGRRRVGSARDGARAFSHGTGRRRHAPPRDARASGAPRAVLKLLRSLIPGATRAGAISAPASSSAPPSHVVSGAHTFPLASHLRIDDGFPRMDWEA